MASSKSLTDLYESFPKIAKLLFQFFTGIITSGIFRIVKFVEKRNLTTLIVGLLGIFTVVGNVIVWVIDLYTEFTENKITFFAD